MSALAVDQNQRVVCGQSTHVGGSNQSRRVADRFTGDVVGRHQGRQRVEDIAIPLRVELLGVEHIHRDGKSMNVARGAAGADDDHFLDFGFIRSAGRLRVCGRERHYQNNEARHPGHINGLRSIRHSRFYQRLLAVPHPFGGSPQGWVSPAFAVDGESAWSMAVKWSEVAEANG